MCVARAAAVVGRFAGARAHGVYYKYPPIVLNSCAQRSERGRSGAPSRYMARYNQKRKRSSGPIRTNKRRRIFKRRYIRRRVNAFAVAGEGTLVKPSRNVIRRTSRRRFRNSLYTFTNLFPKYAYLYQNFFSKTTPANVSQYAFSAHPCMGGLFDWTKYTSMETSDAPVDGQFTPVVRGGLCTLTIASEASENLDYKVQLVWIRKGGTLIADGAYFKNVWPLNVTANKGNETTVIMKEWSGTTMATQGVVKIQYKPKIKLYKKEWYNIDNDVMYWFVYVGNTVDQQAVAYEIVHTASATCALLNVKL